MVPFDPNMVLWNADHVRCEPTHIRKAVAALVSAIELTFSPLLSLHFPIPPPCWTTALLQTQADEALSHTAHDNKTSPPRGLTARERWAAVFRSPVAKRQLLLALFIAVGQNLTFANAVLYYSHSIFEEAGVENADIARYVPQPCLLAAQHRGRRATAISHDL